MTLKELIKSNLICGEERVVINNQIKDIFNSRWNELSKEIINKYGDEKVLGFSSSIKRDKPYLYFEVKPTEEDIKKDYLREQKELECFKSDLRKSISDTLVKKLRHYKDTLFYEFYIDGLKEDINKQFIWIVEEAIADFKEEIK